MVASHLAFFSPPIVRNACLSCLLFSTKQKLARSSMIAHQVSSKNRGKRLLAIHTNFYSSTFAMWHGPFILCLLVTLCACAKSKVIVVVVSTKITRSRILGVQVYLQVVTIVKCQIARKCAYMHQGCPKGTTNFLLVTPITHTRSNYLHMHAPYLKHSHTRTLAINEVFAGSLNDGNC